MSKQVFLISYKSHIDTPEKASKPKLNDSQEETPLITPLHASELIHLGYQAVQLITGSKLPLSVLQHLSQDFPSQSSKIAAVDVDEELVSVLQQNAKTIPGGENLFWVNGLHIPQDKVEAFNLLSVMRRERGFINSLRNLGLTNHEAFMFLSHPEIAAKLEAGTTNRFDIRDSNEGGDVILWLNDIEKDSRYKGWPKDIRNVTMFMF